MAQRSGTRGSAGPDKRTGPRPSVHGRVRRWIAGLGTSRRVLLVVGVLVVAALIVALVASMTRGEDLPAESAVAADPDRVAELEAAEVARDEENLDASIDHAEHVQAELVPVLHGLHAVLPADGAAAAPADAAEIAAWQETVDGLIADTEALASGSSDHNIVRNGMLTSLELIGDTLDTVDLATAADATTAEELMELAGGLRTRAVDTWGIAASQLDLRAVAADRGHVHIFLPVSPGDSLEGGLEGHEVPDEDEAPDEHDGSDEHDH